MEKVKRVKHGRGSQKAAYASMGNVLEMAELELEEKYTQQNALIAIKAAQEMTKITLAEVVQARANMEIEQHRSVIRNSNVRIRNVENKKFDELPE